MNTIVITHKDMEIEVVAHNCAEVTYKNKTYTMRGNDEDQVVTLYSDGYMAEDNIRIEVADIIVDNVFTMEESDSPIEGIVDTYEQLVPMIQKLEKLITIAKMLGI